MRRVLPILAVTFCMAAIVLTCVAYGVDAGTLGIAGNGSYQGTATGNQPPQSARTTTQSGYIAPQAGYTVPQTATTVPQTGYGATQTGYGSAQTGYGSAQTGYGSAQTGYGSAQTGYGSAQTGYGSAQTGYNQIPSTMPPQSAANPPGTATPMNQQGVPLPGTNPSQYPQPDGARPDLAGPAGNQLTPPGMRIPVDAAAAGKGAMGAEAFSPEPSRLESAINSVEKTLDLVEPLPPVQRSLTQFGYNFFERVPGLAPAPDTPVGPDYVVGPGDTIQLTVWGSLEGTYPLEVNRSGEINLPRVGTVRVWGVPYGQLPQLLRESLGRVYKNVQLNVTLGKLRLMKVFVVGEVKNPGGYDVGGLASVVNVLSIAGGPTKSGSLRKIQVKRKGQTVETVDLYDFLLKGDKSRDVRLQSGDTVFVPSLGKVAAIDGNVRRPAIYELNGEKTLKDLVALAEGFLPTGYLQRVQISRVSAHEKKEAADLSIDPKASAQAVERQLESIPLHDMDTVTILPIDNLLRGHVRLAGYLLRPGDYALKDGARVSDVVTKDLLLPEYYPQVAEITRYSSQELRPEKIFFDLGKALAGDPANNVALKEFDVLQIYSRWQMEEIPKVRVSGEVQRPGDYRVFDKMTLRDLILAAGNVKKTAFLKSAEITRTVITKDGVKSSIINVDLAEALNGNATQNLPLADMDEVVVRRLPEWKEETDRYVTLRGEIRFPGVYPILKGERLSSLLARAGGYTEKAYLKGAKFTRKAVADVQQKRMDEVIARTEMDIGQKQQELASVAASKEELEATKAALDGLRRSLEKVKATRAEGRVSLALSTAPSFVGSASDVELFGGDALEIPQSPDAVIVLGEVYNPTTVIHTPGTDVRSYLKKAGGPTQNAEEDSIYIIRADGTVESRHQGKSFLFYDSFMSMRLDAGDSIVVPQRMEKVAWMRDIKDIATILGQIALAAGVVVAAGI